MSLDVFNQLLDALAERIAQRLKATSRPESAPAAGGYLSPTRAAKLIDSTPAHVRDLLRAGKLPAVRDGRRVLIKEAALLTYLESPPAATRGRSVDELLARRRGGR